jgi:cysteine-rich repeat protein
MRNIGASAFLLVVGGLAASLGACRETPVGTLELHWDINGDASAGACSAADVTHIRVLVDNTRAETDDDPLDPAWRYADFDCMAGMGFMDLTEGIYRVRVVALKNGVEVRSQVVDLLDVEVIAGETTSLPRNPDFEPPISVEVAVCGDGVVQAGEWCDASDLADNDCESLGFGGGEVTCAGDCSFNTTGCTECGDGVLDPAEACDGSDLAGDTCTSLGFDSGDLLCDADCALDLSGCVGCGNGVVEGGEACDDGNRDPGDGCSADCQLEQSNLTMGWTLYENDGIAESDCAGLSVSTVDVTVTVAGVGTVVHTQTADCATGMEVAPDLAYGLYTVHLSGRDASHVEVATGNSGVMDHTDPDGTDLTVSLIGL